MHHPRTMITFKTHNTSFTYRVGGIVIHNNHILFQQSDDTKFWFLPGGRAELRETAIETLKREMQEELETEITVERLLYVIENLYQERDALFSHELGLYFLMTFPPDSRLYRQHEPFVQEDNGQSLVFAWLPLDGLADLPVYPTCMRTILQTLPEHPTHLAYIEE